jgi:hypothetical protein
VTIALVEFLQSWSWYGNLVLWSLMVPVPLRIPGLVLDGILLCILVRAFWGRRTELVLLLALWLAQTVVLLIWSMRLTTSDAFLADGWEGLMRMGNLSFQVVDSRLEGAFMRSFWVAAFVLPFLVALRWTVRALRNKGSATHGTSCRVGAMGLFAIVLCIMATDVHEFHRLGSCLIESSSPDKRLEVRLVPINAFMDINGVVVLRQGKSIWWMPMGNVGDQLTTRKTEPRFSWEKDTVTLWVDDNRFVFDTRTATPVRPVSQKMKGADATPGHQ